MRCARGIVVIKHRQCGEACSWARREGGDDCQCRRPKGEIYGTTWAPGDKPLLRCGEATNLGPSKPQQKEGELDLEYKDPNQIGFWGALTPGSDSREEDGDDGSVRYQLQVDTCNGTAWSSVARFLARTKADIVLVQEHHLGPSQVAAASKWANKRVWQTVWSAAE